MTRRALLTSLLPLALLRLVPVTWARATTAQPDEGIASGGIGLTREAWEMIHGPATVGQGLLSYEDGAYDVGAPGGVVSFIEFGWVAPGVPSDEAEATARALLPADATLVETFVAPATPSGPTGLRLHRYQSLDLAGVLPEFVASPTGGVLVVYQETRALDSMDVAVTRVSLVGGEAPETV